MNPGLCSPLLSALDPRDRALLLDRAVPRRLKADEILFLSGDRARRVYLVLRGVLKLTARDAEGGETILGLAVPGDFVGDLAAIDDHPQPVDSVAATACELLGLDGDLFIDVVGRNPAATLTLSRILAARMRWMCDAALERASGEVPARLAGRLLDLAELLGRVRGGTVELELPLAQADLGRLAGMCRESACKTLRRFKAQGFLDYRGRRLRILEPEALRRVRTEGYRALGGG
jgi:CRP/FNR family transcriptional regulator, cyclic AMP receptor protein